jgi:type VI secretion system protein ImpA
VIDLEKLLAPIPGDQPAGVDLRYETVYDRLKTTRRAAEDKLQGGHETAPMRPETEWKAIHALASEALANKSKDLQLAVWLLEVEAHTDDFSGAAAGIELVRLLMERYWDTLFPALDDEEPLAFRAGVLEWIESKQQLKLARILKQIPLTDSEHEYTLHHYELAQKRSTVRKQEELENLDQDQVPTSEAFSSAIAAASDTFLESRSAEIAACRQQVDELEKFTDAHFTVREYQLGFGDLRQVLENCQWVVDRVLKPRQEAAAAAAAAQAPSAAVDESASTSIESAARGDVGTSTRPAIAGPVASREGALLQVSAIVDFLMVEDVLDPTPYLLALAIALGPLFAPGEIDETAMLPSPPTPLRERLRKLYVEQDWNTLLREGEHAVSVNPRQPWLDLHRYVITALENLGGSEAGAAAAVRAQLRGILTRHPELADAEFADGTPTANKDTQQWLKQSGLVASPAPIAMVRPVAAESPSADSASEHPSARPADEALALIRSNRTAEAFTLLQAHVSAAPSGRERFLRKLELAEICLDSGNPQLAYPLLDELAATIERAGLEEWEDKQIIAAAWAALVRCARQFENSPQIQARGQEIFARLCRLDLSRALNVEHASTGSAARWFKR